MHFVTRHLLSHLTAYKQIRNVFHFPEPKEIKESNYQVRTTAYDMINFAFYEVANYKQRLNQSPSK